MKPQSGIYQIRNTQNGSRYVGSSATLSHRKAVHFSFLRAGRHPNSHLQRAFDRYGEEAFVFEVIEVVEDEARLSAVEKEYLAALAPEYNLAPAVPAARGYKHTPEALEKISAASKRRWARQGERERASETTKGHPAFERMLHSLHEGNKGRERTPAFCEKKRRAALEKREQSSRLLRERWADPESRRQLMRRRTETP